MDQNDADSVATTLAWRCGYSYRQARSPPYDETDDGLQHYKGSRSVCRPLTTAYDLRPAYDFTLKHTSFSDLPNSRLLHTHILIMSLAAAKQDIRDRPALDGVTEPVNRDQKNADIDRKLHLYGVATALRESRLPANDQIDAALEYALNHSPVETDQLSESGQVLIQDTRQVIDTMRAIVREKNADELLQNFVWHTRQTDTERAKKDPNEVLPVGQDKAQNDASLAAQHLRTLATLVITNAEARKLLSDFGVIGRDLLARGAGKVAEMSRPDEDALRRVDEPGPDHHFVTEGGRNAGTDETPVCPSFAACTSIC